MWIEEHLPKECPFCGQPVRRRGLDGVVYFTHPKCYWRQVRLGFMPFHVTHRVLRSDPIRTPGLRCLRTAHKVELSDGCSHSCVYCYTYSQPRVGLPRGLVILRDDVIPRVIRQLERMVTVKPIYLSPNCDPFQHALTERTTERLVELFSERELPFYFVTKGIITRRVLDLINGYPHVDVQITLTTLNEGKRKLLEPNSPSVASRLKNIEALADIGIRPILRMDPLLPYLTDDERELKELVMTTLDLGVRHVVGSYIGMRPQIWGFIKRYFELVGLDGLIQRYERLFKSQIAVCRFSLASESYRYRRLKGLSETVKTLGKGAVSYSTCLEDGPGSTLFRDLWSSETCEPMYLPVCRKVGDRFEPVSEWQDAAGTA